MKMRKIMTLVLAVAMIVTCFAACGGNSTTNNPAAGTNAADVEIANKIAESLRFKNELTNSNSSITNISNQITRNNQPKSNENTALNQNNDTNLNK